MQEVQNLNGILVAAHDLKAPLCLMRQLALSLELANDASEQSRISQQIVSVSERAMRQVNDLAKIARLEDGLFVMEPLGVRGLCDEVQRELSGLFELEHRKLKVAYTNRQRLAVANRELLHSVIYNFCTNALRYSSRHSASVLSVSDHQDKIRVSLRDHGPALPPEIWHNFQSGGLRRPAHVSMRPGSSGLGLYVISEFSRYMHAELGTTRHRDGVSFFIDLPISNQLSLF